MGLNTEAIMNELTRKEKEEITDMFGELVIEQVRDRALSIAMQIANYSTVNPIKLKQYKLFEHLQHEEKELICDLLSETITDTIFNFLHMFEDYPDIMKLKVIKDNQEYDLSKISEVMGTEISFLDEDGWIQKFSKIGRFIV